MNPNLYQALVQKFGKKGADLMMRQNRAALLYTELQTYGGDLQIKQGLEWLNTLLKVGPFDHSAFLSECDFDTCPPAGERVDWYELGVGDIRPHTENVAGTHFAGWTTGKRHLIPKDHDLMIRPTYEFVNKKIKRGVDELKASFRTKFLNELQRLFIHGYTGSADPSLAGINGWLRRSLGYTNTNKYPSTWGGSPNLSTIMDRQLLDMSQVEEGVYLQAPNMKFIMSRYNHIRLKNTLKTTAADASFSLYFADPKTGIPSYAGFPITTPAFWPNDLIIFTDPKILWARMSDEVTGDIPLIEYDRDIITKRHIFVFSRPVDTELAWDPAVHVAYDDANVVYTGWAAATITD